VLVIADKPPPIPIITKPVSLLTEYTMFEFFDYTFTFDKYTQD